MPRCHRASLLLLLVGARVCSGASPCDEFHCQSCSKEQCSQTVGCWDFSPGEFDPALCQSSSRRLNTLDQSQECSAGENVSVSLVLGFMGGVFACILPCCGCYAKAQQDYYSEFLGAPETDVPPAKATLNAKWVSVSVNHNGDNGTTSTTYTPMFLLTFRAMRKNGTEAWVSSRRSVSWMLYGMFEVGSEIDVRYNASNISEFLMPAEVAIQQQEWQRRGCCSSYCCGLCFLSIFFTVGIGLSVAAWPLSGCWIGIILPIVLVLAGSICGMYVCLPCSQKCSGWNVTIWDIQDKPIVVGEACEVSAAGIMAHSPAAALPEGTISQTEVCEIATEGDAAEKAEKTGEAVVADCVGENSLASQSKPANGDLVKAGREICRRDILMGFVTLSWLKPAPELDGPARLGK